MVFTGGKDGSTGFVKRVASSFSMRKKKNPGDPKGLCRSKSTGANYESIRLQEKKVPDLTSKKRTKSAGVSPQPRREKIDGRVKWRCFEDSDSVCLSSDCTSPSSFLEERRLSVSFHFKVDEKVVSWLSSLANSSLTLDNEANSIKGRRRISKNVEHSVSQNIKENVENIQKEASKEGKICTSTGNSRGKSLANPSLHSPESNKTGDRKLCEGSTSSNSFMTAPNSTSLDSSVQVSEAKKVSFSPSSGTELELESSSSLSNSGVEPSDSNISTASTMVEEQKRQPDDKCLEQATEIVDSKNSNVVEPLFWPFEQIFDWTPEDILKHFSMSPRRKKSLSAKTSTGTSPRSMRAQLQTKKLDFKEGCKRKLVFNGPGPKDSKIPELKRTISNSSNKSSNKNENNNDNKNRNNNDTNKNGMKRIKSMPSRLGKSSKISTKVVPIEVAEETSDTAKEKTAAQKFTRKCRTFLEDDFASINDFSIENLVGLGEFNGREGIDSDFNGDVFLLDDSL